MRLAIIGTQNPDMSFPEWKSMLESKLGGERPSIVITGGSTGIEKYAEFWADINKIPKLVVKPDYNTNGMYANLIRNSVIVGCCDVLFAFPSSFSRILKGMIDKAHEKDKIVRVFKID